MRRAEPSELNAKVVPVLAATLSKKDFERLFPVQFDEMDPFSEPEPSDGALVRLESGPLAVIVFGRATGRLTVSLAENENARKVIPALLAEAPLPRGAITWRVDEKSPKVANAARLRVRSRAGARRAAPMAAKKAAKVPARKAAHRHAPRRKR